MQPTIGFHEIKSRVKESYSDDGKYSDWMESVKVTLGILRKRPWDLSIYKVPNKLRRLKEDAYSPHIVSIGPFHERKHELVAMEEYKWRYMLNFLRRAASPADEDDSDDYSSANENAVTSPADEDSVVVSSTNDDVVTSRAEEANQGNQSPAERALEKCGKAISKLEEVARACYADSINLGKHKLVEILLVDGCFMLELFIKHADKDEEEEEEEEEDTNHPHQEVDPIINNSWMVPALQHDLALLENQIPFVVLHKLFDTMETLANKKFRFSLNKYVLLFFRSALNLSDKTIDDKRRRRRTHKHIADLLHRVVYKPTLIPNPKRILKGQEKIEWGFERCATQLVKSGIQFQPGVDKDRLLDITFSGGVITIPPLYIHEINDSVFRNLIAFEQCSFGCSHHMASYACLMKTLIRSRQDAELLRLKGIIINKLSGDDEEVSTFFKSLCREVVFKEFWFGNLCEEANKYNKSWLHWGRIKAAVKVRWNGYIVTLQNDYFNSPWTIISFFAAFVLLCLTGLQTYYSVRSYYPH